MLLILFSWFTSFLFSPFKTEEYKTYKISGYAQGTTYQITYYAKDEIVKKEHIDDLLNKLDSSLSIYKSHSLISRFNQSKQGAAIDKHLKRVVKKGLEIYKRTDGSFDITVLPLVQAWGFGSKAISHIPDSATIKSILPCIGSDKINLKNSYLKKEKPCTQIDVNGIAQGYSVDVLAAYLDKKGIKNYLVELGGEIKVRGRKQPSKVLMTIGIEGPAEEGNEFPVQKKIYLKTGAITTSGNYRKFYQSGSKKISHLIDPKTGYSLQNEMISVTVWAKNAITADGYDNALMGMGLKRAIEFAEKRKKLEVYFIYHKPDGTVADTATKGFYKYFNEMSL